MKKIIFVIFALISFNSQASHLMGGEITWKCIKSGPDQGSYIFYVKIYRDCQGIPLQDLNNKSLTVHNNVSLTNIPLNYMGATDISPQCNTTNGPNSQFSCGGTNVSAGNGNGAVEEHLFESNPIRILGVPDANGWHFTYTDYARNLAIVNLANNTGQYGFTLRAVMYSYTDSTGSILPNNNDCYDSSPKFYEKPRTILEVNNGYDPLSFSNGFTYSHNAFDEEQDSIAYIWGQPLDGYNGPSYDYLNPNVTNAIPFASGFSINTPIQGIVMNSQTGRTFYPANFQGNYVTCTNVSSYKCGQLVSEVFREVQVVLVPPICNLGDTTGGNIGADTLCNVRPLVQPPFFYPATPAPFRWDTMVHCGDTVSFNFQANDPDFYPNGSRQDLKFEVSGGQFINYNTNPPSPCQNPPCATFNEVNTGATPPFITSGGTGTGYFEWITSCNHVINNCPGGPRPSLYTFVLKVQDDFCPAPAIENQSTIISIYVCPPCSIMKPYPTSTPAICNSNTGTATANPAGGFPPYNVYWFDMSGMPVNPDSLYAGSYQVRVTDSSMCESIDTVVVAQINQNQITIDSSLTIITDSICINTSVGSIDITPSGGLAPYSYLWSNGSNLEDISNLSAGSYSVIVTDANGCTSLSYNYNISSYSHQVNFTISPAFCSNNNGAVTATPSGGFPPYTISWADLNSVQVNPSNLFAGSYQVTIVDSSMCSTIDTVSVSQVFSQVSVDTSLTVFSDSVCSNSTMGSIDITPLGGNAPYTYSWSNGAITEDLYNLGVGTYTVVITDVNGCVSPPQSYVINVLNSQISSTSLITSVLCYGDSTGNIDITPTGGISPYSFMWDNGSTSEDIMNLSAGIYSVQITDSIMCTFVDTFSVIEPSAIQSSLTTGAGSITGIASGGTSPYIYNFYDPTNTFIASSTGNMGTSFTINPLTSGQYLMVVTDANGCLDSTTIVFSTNFSPTVTVNLSNTLCDSLTDLTISVSQDSGEVDMSTGLFQSNAGSFDIVSMNIGDTIGIATMTAAGGSINLNTYLVVSTIVSPSSVIVQSIDSLQGTLGTFTISNQPGGGINILANTIPDGNNFTAGNSSSLTFTNVFVNPCVPLTFTATINSELGDIYTNNFNFSITSIYQFEKSIFKLYPNPTNDILFIDFGYDFIDVRIKIIDVIGKNIYYDRTLNRVSQHEISVGTFKKGSYIISIEVNNRLYSELFVVY